MDEEILSLLENLIKERGQYVWKRRSDPCPRGCCWETILYCTGCSKEYNLRFTDAPDEEDREHDASCFFKNEYPKLAAWAKVERELLEAAS
jgi:hypothetical protein